METHPDADFQQFLKDGRFMLQRSRATGRYFFYPRVMEPGTGSTDLEWTPASGGGTVYSTTVVRPVPPAPAHNVVLVDLDEGPRMMSRVEGVPPDAVKIGMRVRARIAHDNELHYVVFDPA
jgi:uncharacterized protein